MPNIDEIIRKAMEEGAFDNLRGAGKPLNLEDNPYIDPSWQLAYHLLKENGFALSFIETRQAIDTELAAARANLARAWEWRQANAVRQDDARWVETQWQNALAAFMETVEALNKRISDYNISIPLDRFHRQKVSVSDEVGRLSS